MVRSARAALLPTFALVLASCSLPSGLDEPYYELRPATHWIKELGASHLYHYGFFGTQDRSRRSIEALQKMGPAAVPACLRALDDKRWHVRAGAAHALALYGADAREAVAALAAAVMDPDPTVRQLATDALATIGAEAMAAIPLLSQGLAHHDPMIRISVAYALVRLDPSNDAAVQVLIEGVQYVDVEFRDALQRSWGADWQKYMNAMEIKTSAGQRIMNHEEQVRQYAARWLGQLGPTARRALPELIAALSSPYARVRMAAADALTGIGVEDEGTVSSLRELLNNEDPMVRAAAQTALGKLDPQSRPTAPSR